MATPLGPIKVSEHLANRDNNLNLVRVIAAGAVLISHSVPISLGSGTSEPLEQVAGASLGWLAVAVFFSLSGLLIANSFDRSASAERFVVARILRLFPGLALVLVLTVLVGAAITSLGPAAYFGSAETWAYIPRNLSLAFLQYPLPGVFDANPYPQAINGSLWTLFYEVTCYTVLFFAGLIGVLRSKWFSTVLVGVLAAGFLVCIHVDSPEGGLVLRLYLLTKLAFPFGLGVLAYVWRERFVFDWRIALGLWAVFAISAGSTLAQFWVVLALAYSAGWFGFVPKGRLLEYNRLGDYSYGIYIYAFPVQQTFAFLYPSSGPVWNIALATPVTVILAMLSWHLVEERALAQIKPVAGVLKALRTQRRRAPDN